MVSRARVKQTWADDCRQSCADACTKLAFSKPFAACLCPALPSSDAMMILTARPWSAGELLNPSLDFLVRSQESSIRVDGNLPMNSKHLLLGKLILHAAGLEYHMQSPACFTQLIRIKLWTDAAHD